jgi:hypothetical protein
MATDQYLFTIDTLSLPPAKPDDTPPSSPELPGPDRALFAPDYRWCRWFGREHWFTPAQAACVRVLWELLRNGIPEASQTTILRAAKLDQERLRDVFRRQGRPIDAWGRMIVPGEGRGAYRLRCEPDAR